MKRNNIKKKKCRDFADIKGKKKTTTITKTKSCLHRLQESIRSTETCFKTS